MSSSCGRQPGGVGRDDEHRVVSVLRQLAGDARPVSVARIGPADAGDGDHRIVDMIGEVDERVSEVAAPVVSDQPSIQAMAPSCGAM